MQVLILTTNTIHHTYFVKKLTKLNIEINVICERRRIKYPFSTFHKFEKKRDQYEKKKWFKKKISILKQSKSLQFVDNINSLDPKKLNFSKYKIIFVFGIGILKKKFLSKIKSHILNFHGGNPEKYRGLDSHLWAIRNKDFKNFTVTLHKLITEVDKGKILFKKKINLYKNMKLYQLRKINTEICVELAKKVINLLKNKKSLNFKKQKKVGKYYSAMNSDQKNICNIAFSNYTKKLNG
tara:strand:- start:887 stop:1600 length:714 start_codon:yes stop_codon:yes gene_type:complete